MIDTINFYIPIDAQKAIKTGNSYYWAGNTKNLKLTAKDNRLYINGSIAKYADKGIEGLGIKDGLQALKDLEQTLKADFSKSVVCRVDYCKTLETDKPPYYYLECLDKVPRFLKCVHSEKEKETVTFFTKTGARAFCAYDKGLESETDKNLLRLELRIMKKKAVQKILGNNKTVFDVFDMETFNRLEKEYMDFYNSINKHDVRTVRHFLKSESCNARTFFEYMTANFKALCPSEYDALLKDFVKNMDTQNRYRTLCKERKNGFLEGVKGKNGILYELDQKNAIQAH